MLIKRVALVVVLVAVAWLLTVYEDRMPDSVRNFGSRDITKVDAEAGITFSYPAGYALQEILPVPQDHRDLVKSFVLMPQEDYDIVSTLEGTEGPPAITILVFNNPEGLSIDAWMKKPDIIQYIPPQAQEPNPIEVDGEFAVLFEADGLYRSDNVIVAHDTRIVLMSGAFMDTESPQRTVFAGMVKSFRFIPKGI